MRKYYVHVCLVMLLIFGCTNFTLNLSQRLGYTLRAPLALPPGSYEIKELGDGWHTFRLNIGGKDRLFLRRLYPNYENTESLTEILEPQ